MNYNQKAELGEAYEQFVKNCKYIDGVIYSPDIYAGKIIKGILTAKTGDSYVAGTSWFLAEDGFSNYKNYDTKKWLISSILKGGLDSIRVDINIKIHPVGCPLREKLLKKLGKC